MRGALIPVWVFAIASLLLFGASFFFYKTGYPTLAMDIQIHATYFVLGQLHVLVISAAICGLFALGYLTIARTLQLRPSPVLWITHFLVTMIALFGLNTIGYLSPPGVARIQPDPAFLPYASRMLASYLSLLLLSCALFVAIVVSSGIKKLVRRDGHLK